MKDSFQSFERPFQMFVNRPGLTTSFVTKKIEEENNNKHKGQEKLTKVASRLTEKILTLVQ